MQVFDSSSHRHTVLYVVIPMIVNSGLPVPYEMRNFGIVRFVYLPFSLEIYKIRGRPHQHLQRQSERCHVTGIGRGGGEPASLYCHGYYSVEKHSLELASNSGSWRIKNSAWYNRGSTRAAHQTTLYIGTWGHTTKIRWWMFCSKLDDRLANMVKVSHKQNQQGQ